MIKEIVLLIILQVIFIALYQFPNTYVWNAIKAAIVFGVFILYNYLTKDIKDIDIGLEFINKFISSLYLFL